MIVASKSKDAAIWRGSKEACVFKCIASAVYARPLAVPYAEDAIILAALEQADLLAPPYGGRGKLLIYARPEDDVMLGKPLSSLAIVAYRKCQAAIRDTPK